MKPSSQEPIEVSQLFLALTRPIMVAGVTYDFMVVNAMITTLAFLGSGNLLMFFIGAPIHMIGYVMSLKDPHIFSLLSVALTKHGNTHAANKKLWGCNNYGPDNRTGQGRMALKKTNNGEAALNDKPLSQFIPYTAHIDERTIATREGFLVQCIELEGLDFETLDQADINSLSQGRNTLLKTLADSAISISYHVLRSKITTGGTKNDYQGFAKELNDEWQQHLASKQLYQNRHYLSITLRPRSGTAGVAESIKRTLFKSINKDATQSETKENIKTLDDISAQIRTSLKSYGPKQLSTYTDKKGILKSQLLEFFFSLINQDEQSLNLPHGSIAEYLPAKRFFFGRDAIEIRGASARDITYGAMVSVKEYAPKTCPGMMDQLLRASNEMVISQHFSFIERPKALNTLKTVIRQMDMADDAAISLQEDLIQAMDDAESRRIVFGDHQLSILVKAPSVKNLDTGITDIMSQLRDLGMVATREDLYLEACYWSQLPANLSYQARTSMISSQNFAGLASLHNFPTGKKSGNHWGEYVSLLETTSGAPYYFSFHHNDLGNFNLFGPSGSGKTVLLLFLLAQAQKFKPRSIFFDKDRGAEIFIRAMGGQYAIIEPGIPTGFNPLACGGSETERAFLREWLAQLLMPLDGRQLSANERAIIARAIEHNFEAPPAHRRLRYLAELFKGHERAGADSLEAKLAPWHSHGEHAWLFDNEHDELSLNNQLIGFDLTSILDNPSCRTPALMYMFERVNKLFNGDKVILFIDEGWKALDDPAFEHKIKDWLKTIRKQNGIIGFGSQSVGDAVNSRIADSLIEQCATQIFMPNNKAKEDDYAKFGISQKEFEIIKTTDKASHAFLIKHGQHSVVAKLDLSSMERAIAVLSGTTDTVRLVEKIRKTTGEQPEKWLPTFHKERKRAA